MYDSTVSVNLEKTTSTICDRQFSCIKSITDFAHYLLSVFPFIYYYTFNTGNTHLPAYFMRTIQSITSDEVETDLMEIEFIQVSHQLTQPRSRNQIKLPSVTKPVVKFR